MCRSLCRSEAPLLWVAVELVTGSCAPRYNSGDRVIIVKWWRCHPEFADPDWGLVVRFNAFRFKALRFVVLLDLSLAMLLSALSSFLVGSLIGLSVWMAYPHVRGYWQLA